MKKLHLLFTATICGLALSASAQNGVWCGTEAHNLNLIQNGTTPMSAMDALQANQQEANRMVREGVRGGGGPRIIPVVFHVIHLGGAENISRDQIVDQVNTLTLDYTRTNLDTADTRDIFKPVADNPNVEFRLATLDPDGNCTDGVVRVMSPLTENATDAVKAVSYWPSNKYFNVWVVKSIASDGGTGTTLGYAQFPGFGSAQTDGIVIRHDYTGSIGTAAPFGGVGRTLTHEAGHWLGLFHTFQGGCDGGFFGENIDDTPLVLEANFNCNFNINSCTNENPDLPDQIENYMDYTGGSCQNMFSQGQVANMNSVLSGSRANIISQANLIATGTATFTEPDCAPIAAFTASNWLVCAGEPVTFTDASFNGTVTGYDWQMTGATPSTSTASNPTVTYAQAGTYNVTFTASNGQGSNSTTTTGVVTVLPAAAQINTFLVQEGFEQPNPDIIIYNQGDIGLGWNREQFAYTGTWGHRINIRNGNVIGVMDEFILPSLNITQMNSPALTFKVAYRQRNNNNVLSQDRLRVCVSTNCGESWSVRYNKAGSVLGSVAGAVSTDWTPTSQADWREETVSLSTVAGAEHLLVKFQSTSDEGNSIFVDDINISGPAGMEDDQPFGQTSIYPDPVNSTSFLELNSNQAEQIDLIIIDALGRVLLTQRHTTSVGANRISMANVEAFAPGVYRLVLSSAAGRVSIPFVR